MGGVGAAGMNEMGGEASEGGEGEERDGSSGGAASKSEEKRSGWAQQARKIGGSDLPRTRMIAHCTRWRRRDDKSCVGRGSRW